MCVINTNDLVFTVTKKFTVNIPAGKTQDQLDNLVHDLANSVVIEDVDTLLLVESELVDVQYSVGSRIAVGDHVVVDDDWQGRVVSVNGQFAVVVDQDDDAFSVTLGQLRK